MTALQGLLDKDGVVLKRPVGWSLKFIALDLSLTSTGVATVAGAARLIPPKGCVGVPRLRWIRAEVMRLVIPRPDLRADLVVIEGYAFGRIEQAHHMGELGGVIRLALADAQIFYVEIPPASLKMFATGKGNASKEQVLGDAIRKLGYTGHSNDEADALFLHAMAVAHYTRQYDCTAVQRKALEKIQWPSLPTSEIAR